MYLNTRIALLAVVLSSIHVFSTYLFIYIVIYVFSFVYFIYVLKQLFIYLLSNLVNWSVKERNTTWQRSAQTTLPTRIPLHLESSPPRPRLPGSLRSQLPGG